MAIELLPKDPMMLLSFVNTRLRDDKLTLDEFCLQFDVEQDVIVEKLAQLDYKYDENLRKFI